MRAYLYLKSGAVVETDVEEISTTEAGSELTGIKWVKSAKGKRLMFIACGDVSAITVDKR